MQEQLARTDRLASLGTLAAGVAHEINNPLTFMALGIELASRRIAASGLSAHEKEQILATLADVSRGADRVALVVRDLKTFSRVAEDEGHPVDVRDVIDSALRIVAHRSKHFAEVVSFVDGLPPVSANAARLEQVFVNLLLNAVQAFEEARAGNRIELRGGLDGERVFIDVEDNGPGISADVTPRIFDPFFTTKPVGEGTGLGLAIVHGILTQMGGDITVTSAVGRGTVFRVTLAVAGRRGEPLTSEVPASDVVAKRARVLIVDDEREVAAVMKRALDARHDVVALTSPKEALELIASGAELDVVFCDLAMPGMSGTELYREVVRTRPELASRFVIVTGGAISGRMQGFLDSWTGPCLEKPFSRRDLEDTLLAVTGGTVRAATG
jgi:CheY-like chemotaxis protein